MTDGRIAGDPIGGGVIIDRTRQNVARFNSRWTMKRHAEARNFAYLLAARNVRLAKRGKHRIQ